jgi:hypothetical protein
MYLKEELEKKWAPVLDHEKSPKFTDPYRRAVTGVLLENQDKLAKQEKNIAERMMLSEAAPTNATGSGITNYDPIMVSLLRRALPNMIAYDFCGVQPMTGPTGTVFFMKSRYVSQSGTEAFFNEANTAFTAKNAAGANGTSSGSTSNTDPTFDFSDSSTYGVGTGMTTANGEALGSVAGHAFPEMAFSIDKVTVTAIERALKAEYSIELSQDLKAIHGLDAETELSNILTTEILSEINRMIIRTIYRCASLGCQVGTTTQYTFDLDTDANGRWFGEKIAGLSFQLERECNAIAKATRRGKGNIMIVSSDVASALAMAGKLVYTPATSETLQVDDTGNTYAGTIHGGRMKVYIDPYFGGTANGNELACVGYKGTSPWDAGLFYCPYVPLQMMKAIGQDTFQPRIGFKTRFGLVANPFATAAADGVVGDRNTSNQANIYYRIFKIKNLL